MDNSDINLDNIDSINKRDVSLDNSDIDSINNTDINSIESISNIYPNINTINNSDLIEKIESAAINYIFLVKEAISRISGRQFSDEEYKRFVEIGEKMGISIIDFISVVKHDVNKYQTKEVVTKAISDVIDKAYDKDR